MKITAFWDLKLYSWQIGTNISEKAATAICRIEELQNISLPENFKE
jgi:hypothetical protein